MVKKPTPKKTPAELKREVDERARAVEDHEPALEPEQSAEAAPWEDEDAADPVASATDMDTRGTDAPPGEPLGDPIPPSRPGPPVHVAPMSDDRKRYLLHHVSALKASPEAQHLIDEGLIVIVDGHVELTDKGRKLLETL